MIRVSIANTGKIYVTIPDDGPIRIRMVGIEPIRINAFNYPPEIDRINNELTQVKESVSEASASAEQALANSAEAILTAEQAEQLANDIAQELASLGTKVFACASFNKVQGGTVTGDVTSIATPNDGNTLRVNEAAAGLTVDFNFTAVDSFNVIAMHLRYAGGANHTWQIQLYNFITSQFQTIGENIGTTSDIVWFNLPVVADEQFINNGNVVLRFNHVSPFISTHYALFDYVALSSNLAIVNPPIQKENVIGLKTTDSPEFADIKVTQLKSVTDSGVVTDTIWAWLGATTSSVLSVVSNLITKVFNLYPQTGITFSGAIDLTKVDTHYSNYTQTGVLEITIAANSIVGGSAEITITANGSAITVTGATQYGDTALDYTNGKINHLLFTRFTNGVYYSVRQLN